MRNIFIVVKHEIITSMSKRSFWIMTFLFPAVIIGINIGTQIFANRTFNQSEALIPTENPAGDAGRIGYVDQSGLIAELPPAVPAGMLVALPSQAEAEAALEAGQVEQYFLVPAGFLETGEVVMVSRELKPFGDTKEALVKYLLSYNLSGDETIAAVLVDPLPVVVSHSIAPQGGGDRSNPMAFYVPYATLFVFFFLLTMSSGFMLQSVSREKENRTVEILLLSLQPRELMLGKVLGLSVIALFQMAVWLGLGLAALARGRQFVADLSAFSLPAGFVLWAVLYFLLGYLLYAALMGAIGALAPSAREAGQFTFLVLLPLMIPIWVNTSFIQSPNGALATALSLFPLTAPTSMITRLASGGVPGWQLATSLLALAVTTYLIVLISARFFRSDILLSSRAINWQRLAQEFRRS